MADDLVEAARALMWESGAPVFTVTQVVAAAGTSLKSFYRCFDSKDELLVALFDDDARSGAEALAAAVDAPGRSGRPGALRGGGRCSGSSPSTAGSPMPPPSSASTCDWPSRGPTELRAVLQPFVDIFEVELDNAGQPRARSTRTMPGATPARCSIWSCPTSTPSLPPDRRPPADVADDLWAFCAAALRP